MIVPSEGLSSTINRWKNVASPGRRRLKKMDRGEFSSCHPALNPAIPPGISKEMKQFCRIIPTVVVLLALPISVSAVDFKADVAPIFEQKCVGCHGPDKQKGKLRLDSLENALKGGKGGPALKPGDPDASELIKRVELPKDNDDHMPTEGDPLSKEQITILREWIKAGATWPEGVVLTAKGGKEPATPHDTNAAAAPKAPAGPPPPPLPDLPKDFVPTAAETNAIAAIAKSGVDVRLIAQNGPWREANFRLAGTNITDAVIAPLKDVTSLVELNLAMTRVTDGGLAAIEGLGYLQNLQLQLTGAGDGAASHIGKLTNLVILNLYGTPVTDASLPAFKELGHLRSLYLWQTKVTPEGVKQLKEARPGLYINTGWEPPSTNAVPATNAPAASGDKK